MAANLVISEIGFVRFEICARSFREILWITELIKVCVCVEKAGVALSVRAIFPDIHFPEYPSSRSNEFALTKLIFINQLLQLHLNATLLMMEGGFEGKGLGVTGVMMGALR
ncbi:hypothetical protein CEXT_505771 [Caerostris extrusa]|uniref:Uncharacterized protein n=1 Tax=Caerostris extrusa TaxID=172846 RepID=A0AAV4MEU9_CAEEX|nr:hypothetical protein CEXT_505771 [Caerostris extrusa]